MDFGIGGLGFGGGEVGPINAPATLGTRYFTAASLHLYLASVRSILTNTILVSALKSSTR